MSKKYMETDSSFKHLMKIVSLGMPIRHPQSEFFTIEMAR